MPAPGSNAPKFGPRAIEARAAHPVIERPKWLDGKKTFLGLGLAAAGLILGRMGITMPKEEVEDFLDWLGANWDTIAVGLGILGAGYGRVKASKRFQKQIEKATNVVLLLCAMTFVGCCSSPSKRLLGHANSDYDAGYRHGAWDTINLAKP